MLGLLLLPVLLLPLSGMGPAWTALGEVLLVLLAWWIWRSTPGLGRAVRLVFVQGEWRLSNRTGNGETIEQIRAGHVAPGFLSAKLKTGTSRVNLVAFADAMSASEHWQLRRLALRGPTRSKNGAP